VQVIDEIEGKAIFKEVKLTAAEEAWALVEDNFRSNPHRNATRYLTMAETLLKNFRISKLKGFDWFPLAGGHAVDFGDQPDAECVQPLPVARRVAPSLAVGQRPCELQVAGSQRTDCGRRRRVSHRVPPHGHR